VAASVEGQVTDESFRRPTTAAEWEAYHSIRKRVLFDLRGQGDAYDTDHADEHRPEHHPFVLWENGVAIGVIRIDVHGKLAMLRRVAIRDDLHRRGHGRRLLQAAERFASEQGCTRVESHVDRSAIGFYERCGFTRVAPTMGHVAMLMSKALP
jgi:GNAT superfamily N-acetyltransferase